MKISNSTTSNTQKTVRAALIAAVYVAICLMLAPISFGPVQVRVSEALTLLPVLCPEAVFGVIIGCFIANLIASAPIDMLVGTLATLLAALATRKLRKVRFKGLPVLASVPPVVFNALIIGVELTILYFSPNPSALVYLTNIGSVFIGQFISCCILGLLLIFTIEKNPALRKLFGLPAKPTP